MTVMEYILKTRIVLAKGLLISEKIPVSEVSSRCGFSSVSYFCRVFKEETGSNFIDFVNDVRLEKARNLLKKLELSIKEVSFDCGYSDQNYFSKIFRRKFGITATEYRNSL